MNPHIINCLMKGYNERLKHEDMLQHMWWGAYGISALTVAIEHCLAGKKAKSEYVKEPITSKAFENNGLTEEEIYERELRKALFAEEQWINAGKRKGLPKTVF